METKFINTENSKTNGPRKFVFNLLKKIRFKKFKQTCFSSKLVYLLHLEKIRQQYKNNKLKIIASLRNNEFVLPDSSYSGSKSKIIPSIS